MKLEKYIGAPVTAVQITEDNYKEVAAWANFAGVSESDRGIRLFVKVGGKSYPVTAVIGDWVVCDYRGVFRVFGSKPFSRVFKPLVDVAMVEENFWLEDL